MNYDDLYLLSLIKKLREQLAYAVSLLGTLMATQQAFKTFYQEGTLNPNTAGIVPANTNIGGLYNQIDGNGQSIQLFVWSVPQQKWV